MQFFGRHSIASRFNLLYLFSVSIASTSRKAFSESENEAPHSLHENGRSAICHRLCTFSCDLLINDMSYSEHGTASVAHAGPDSFSNATLRRMKHTLHVSLDVPRQRESIGKRLVVYASLWNDFSPVSIRWYRVANDFQHVSHNYIN